MSSQVKVSSVLFLLLTPDPLDANVQVLLLGSGDSGKSTILKVSGSCLDAGQCIHYSYRHPPHFVSLSLRMSN